jgi:hypothetical protein
MPTFERLQVHGELRGVVLVVAGEAGHERAVGRRSLQDDCVDQAERLRVHQAGAARRSEQHRGCRVRRGVLAVEERRAVEPAPVELDGAAAYGLVDRSSAFAELISGPKSSAFTVDRGHVRVRRLARRISRT